MHFYLHFKTTAKVQSLITCRINKLIVAMPLLETRDRQNRDKRETGERETRDLERQRLERD